MRFRDNPGIQRRVEWVLHKVILLSLLVAVFATTVSDGYGRIEIPRQGGIPVGRFTFYPSLLVEFGHESNVLLTTEDIGTIPSGVYIARVNLKMDMPLGAHHISWSYSPQYKDYTTDRFVADDPMSHFLDFDSIFQIGRSFSLGFEDHYVRGVTESSEYDPGGERAIGLSPFTLHQPQMNLELRVGSRQRVTVSPRYARARFDDNNAALRFSYDTKALDARYGFRISGPTELSGFLSWENTEQTRTSGFLTDTALATEAAGIGISRSNNENVVTSFSTAYTVVSVEGGQGSDFSGMAYEASGNWLLNDQMQVNLSARRQPYQSFFLSNAFYVNNMLSVRLIHQVGSRTFWQGVARYQINDYPEPTISPPDSGDSWLPAAGLKRQDNSGDVEIGVAYRFSSSMRMYIGYNYQQRRSNVQQCVEPIDVTINDNQICDGVVISPFNFTDDRVVFRIEAGWL